jgi:hypothetical protein
MADAPISNDQREFRCNHCDGAIRIPKDLPPTTGPCPHCSGIITSPAPEAETKAAEVVPAKVEAAAPAPPVPEPSPVVAPIRETPPEPPAVPATLDVPAVPAVTPSVARRTGPPPPPGSARQETRPAASTVDTAKPGDGEKPPEPPAKPAEKKAPKPKRSGLITLMLVLLALALILLGVVYLIIQELGKNIAPPVPDAPVGTSSVNDANYIRVGWKKDASRVLGEYIAGTTAREKIPTILNGETLAPEVIDFYGGSVIDDSDTPAEDFSVYELPEEDRKRGLFMMIYDLPPQLEIKEFFRPLASLEVQYGLDEADLLLSTVARVGNFTTEPLRVHAFFKRTDQGLKLDWEVFTQTKYRTFLNFVELPETGRTGIFRVIVMEDVPEKGHAVPGTRTYRLVDPANISDSARVNVKVDSDAGRTLSEINWRDGNEKEPVTRTATVELEWAGEPNAPELALKRFICWEFLGLGGDEAPATASTQ